jgi:hypothetical protein
LPAVLYECETLSLTLWEEQRLRVFETRVLRVTFRLMRDEIIQSWRKMNNKEFHNLYSLPDIIRMVKSRRMKWAWHVTHMAENKNVYRVLLGISEGKRPLVRPRQESNIKMDL